MDGINIRLKELVVQEGLTASTFADRIGVLRSALSHILSGRNKPGADFIAKLLVAIPDVNANWLFTGTGEMYLNRKPVAVTSEAAPAEKSPGRQLDILTQLAEMFPEEYGQDPDEPDEEPEPSRPAPPVSFQVPQKTPAVSSGEKKLVKIVMVYDDKTFTELKPEDSWI